jgi:hypothetical protein
VVLLVSFNLLKLEKGVSESEWNQRETSRLLRAVFERDRNDQLKERIRERVVRNLVELSMDQYGNNVVQACLIPSIRMPLFSAVLLQRGAGSKRSCACPASISGSWCRTTAPATSSAPA